MFIHQEHFCRTDSIAPAVVIDNSDYDLCGRYDGTKATLCGSGEIPQFFFNSSVTAAELEEGKPVKIVFARGEVSFKLKGTGSAGNKLKVNTTGGTIVASNTVADAVLSETDFAIALQDWTDGDETLCTILTPKGA